MDKIIDLDKYTDLELVKIYSEVIEKLKERNVIRTRNVVGELGEFYAFQHYNSTPGLPSLVPALTITKDVDAFNRNKESYAIKSTNTGRLGAIWGMNQDESFSGKPLFDYMIIVKFDGKYTVEYFLEITWDTFMKFKSMHSRMKTYTLNITKALIDESKVVFKDK